MRSPFPTLDYIQLMDVEHRHVPEMSKVTEMKLTQYMKRVQQERGITEQEAESIVRMRFHMRRLAMRVGK